MDGTPAWLPHLAGLRVDRVFLKGSTIRIEATTTSTHADCPGCGCTFGRVHSRYERRLADPGIGGRPALLVLTVRRFFCDQASCPRTTFAEQVPGLTRKYGRHTGPADHVVAAVAMALGGRAGARLVGRLTLPTSRMTLLRVIRDMPELPVVAGLRGELTKRYRPGAQRLIAATVNGNRTRGSGAPGLTPSPWRKPGTVSADRACRRGGGAHGSGRRDAGWVS